MAILLPLKSENYRTSSLEVLQQSSAGVRSADAIRGSVDLVSLFGQKFMVVRARSIDGIDGSRALNN